MINTIEELEALPVGSVIKNRHGWVLAKDSDGWWSFGFDSYEPEEVAQDMLPATLLIPNTLSREKWSELAGVLNCDYWVAADILAEVLHGLGIEVSDV